MNASVAKIVPIGLLERRFARLRDKILKSRRPIVLACTLGGEIGILTYCTHSSITGVPTIESFVSAGLLYTAAELLRGQTERDRCWRAAGSSLP